MEGDSWSRLKFKPRRWGYSDGVRQVIKRLRAGAQQHPLLAHSPSWGQGGREMNHDLQIPAALEPYRSQQRWVVWRLEQANGKPTKRPYQPTTRR